MPSSPSLASHPSPTFPRSHSSYTSRPRLKKQSIPLSPDPTISVELLVQQSKARAAMKLWEDALEDANAVRCCPLR